MTLRSQDTKKHSTHSVLHVLCIDIDAELGDVVQHRMNESGIMTQVVVVHNLSTLVEQLETIRPDVVLSAMSLADCQIKDILHTIRFKYPLVPILLIPAESSPAITEALRLGADDYVLRSRLQRLPYAIQLASEKKQIEGEKRHIEQELAVNKELYRVVMDNSPDITSIMLKDGTVSYTNKAFAKVLHIKHVPSPYPGSRFPSLSIADFIAPHDIEEFITVFQEVLHSGDSHDIVIRCIAADGTLVYVESRLERITTEHKTFAVIIVSRDITQRYTQEQELRRLKDELENRVQQQRLAVEESEEQLDLQVQEREEAERHIKIAYSIINQANDAMILFSSQGKVLFMNDVAATSLGYTWSEIQALKPHEICQEISSEAEWRLFRHRLYQQTTTITEVHYLRSDREYMPVEITAKIIRVQSENFILVVGYDLSERRKHERELRMAYNLINQSHDGIIVSELNGRIISTNRVIQQETGYSEEELRNIRFTDLDLQVNVEADSLKRNTRMLLRKGKILTETVFRRRDGTVFPVEISSTLILHDNQRYLVSVMRDISQRKELERQVQRTQQLYAEISNSYPNGIVLVFDPQFLCQYAGGQDFRVLGSSPDDIIGHTLFDIFPPRVADFMMMSLEPTLQGQQVSFEMRLTGNDYVFNAVPLYDSFGSITQILAVSQNITERKRAEELVRQQSAVFNEILNNIPIGIFIKNLAGKYLVFNNYAANLVGKSAQDIIGQDSSFIYDGLVLEDMQTMDMQALRADGEPVTHEYRFNVNNSESHFINGAQLVQLPEEGSAILGYSVDITPIKQAQKQIENQQKFIRNVIDTSPNLIYVKNADGVYLLVNRTMSLLFGKVPSEIENKAIQDFEPRLVGKEYFRAAEMLAFETKQIVRQEELISTYNTRRMYVDISLIPLDTEIFPTLLGVGTDITARKSAEDEMRSALEKEREVGELKSRFVTMVSHEFRTPLTSIRSSAELLMRFKDRLDTEKRDSYLKSIDNSVVRMTQMMEDVLFISKAEQAVLAFKPDLTNVRDILTVIVTELQWSFEKASERIRISIAEDFPTFAILDIGLLRHILTNLLSNALKYSPLTSAVDIEITLLPVLSEKVSHDNTDDDQRHDIEFVIRDYGIGIPLEDQGKMFESFHRASNIGNIPGTGLGMVIVKRSVEAHGGSITFESIQNEGTTFTVRIPFLSQNQQS